MRVDESVVEQDTQKANRLQIDLLKLLTDIEGQEVNLDKNFVLLGVMLQDVRASKLWEPMGYSGYNAFIKSISEKFPNTSRTKLYATAQIAEQLLDVAAPQDVIDMGMSKASKLASAIKKADGKKPTDELLAKARDSKVTVAEFDKAVAGEFQIVNQFENGTWFDMAGFYASKEELEEIMRGVRIACLTDPTISILEKWNDNAASHLRKEVIQRWVMTYLATYEAEINGQNKGNGGDRSGDSETSQDF